MNVPSLPATDLAFVADDASLAKMVADLQGSTRLSVDLESDGLHAYRAGLCLVQVAAEDGRVWIVDTMALPIAPLAEILGANGPIKVVHDVAFDGRLLGEHGVRLARCHDTSIAARLLGRQRTGLGTLLEELGVHLDKSLQTHDWRKRPLRPEELAYVAGDVRHLMALDDRLQGEATERGIAIEIQEETDFRLASAWDAAIDPDRRPPYVRMKGIEKLRAVRDLESGDGARTSSEAKIELAVLRELATVREKEAERRNIPPYKILGNEPLFTMATLRPRTFAQMDKVRGLGPHIRALSGELVAAVGRGVEAGAVPLEDHAWFVRPKLSPDEAKARRTREAKLTGWRKRAAAERTVDEQVVLPGHLSKAIASADPTSIEGLAAIHGMSLQRVERYGAQILAALAAEVVEAPPTAPAADGSPPPSPSEPSDG